ncbi:hypothetical protein Tco_1572555 [Tanacetum coccineum]
MALYSLQQCDMFVVVMETDIQEKDKKKDKNKQNQARDGKDKVKSKPKSVKVRKSTQTKSNVNQVKKIQLEGLKLPNLKLYYKNKKSRAKIYNEVIRDEGPKLPTCPKPFFPTNKTPDTTHGCLPTLLPYNLYNPLGKTFPPPPLSPPSFIIAMLAIPHHFPSDFDGYD